MKRLPIFATLRDALALVWRDRRDFVAFAYLPVIANALLGVALQSSLPSPLPNDAAALIASLSGVTIAIWLVSLVATIGFYIVFALAWHRRCLLPGETTTVGAALRWRARHWRFFGVTMALAIGVILAAVVLNFAAAPVAAALFAGNSGAGGIFSVVLSFIVVTLAMRFLLLFPAIAIDEPMTPAESWRRTRGNGATLFMLLFAISLAIAIVHQILVLAWVTALGSFAANGSLLALLALALLVQSLAFIGVALMTTVVSIAYRELDGSAAAPTV
ncbi:MAG: hypothetical protein WD036_04680 [Bauldia sp.]